MTGVVDGLVDDVDGTDAGRGDPRLGERGGRGDAQRDECEHAARGDPIREAVSTIHRVTRQTVLDFDRSFSLSANASSMASRNAWLFTGPLRTR